MHGVVQKPSALGSKSTAKAQWRASRFVRTNRITCYTIFFGHVTGLVTSHLLGRIPGHMMSHVTDHVIGFMAVARWLMRHVT